jgi:alkylation response protein AidB-like acyl-CoA dehydrogenase
MDFELTEEQRLYRRAIRDFAEKDLKPVAAETDETGELPWEALRKGVDLGLFGLQIPEEYGGTGLDAICYAIAIEEVGRVCGSTGLSVAAHNGLGCFPIAAFGTEEQKRKYLPKLASGDVLGSLALTEPNAGSDLGAVRTRAVKEGDSWILDGSKAWITNPGYANVVIVLARTDPEADKHGLSMILVEADTPGMIVHPKETKMGVRGSPTQAISFDECRVPLENLLGEEGRGLHQALATLDGGRISIGALSLGIAQGAFEEAIAYAKERTAFGVSISQHQAVQWMLADAATEIDAARLLLYRAAWLKSQGKRFTKEAAMAKMYASEVGERVCRNAIQIHGSYGYSREYPVERMYRDIRLMTIGEGTSEIQRLVIARQVLA